MDGLSALSSWQKYYVYSHAVIESYERYDLKKDSGIYNQLQVSYLDSISSESTSYFGFIDKLDFPLLSS